MNRQAPPNGNGAPPNAPIPVPVGKLDHNTDQARRERELQLLWLAARTLVHIDEKLSDQVILHQQTVDLLRQILTKDRLP